MKNWLTELQQIIFILCHCTFDMFLFQKKSRRTFFFLNNKTEKAVLRGTLSYLNRNKKSEHCREGIVRSVLVFLWASERRRRVRERQSCCQPPSWRTLDAAHGRRPPSPKPPNWPLRPPAPPAPPAPSRQRPSHQVTTHPFAVSLRQPSPHPHTLTLSHPHPHPHSHTPVYSSISFVLEQDLPEPDSACLITNHCSSFIRIPCTLI